LFMHQTMVQTLFQRWNQPILNNWYVFCVTLLLHIQNIKSALLTTNLLIEFEHFKKSKNDSPNFWDQMD
jgi:hypothetical protein